MALYPTLTEAPYVKIGGSSEQKVLRSNFDDIGKEQRKRKWLYQKRNITLLYNNISDTELSELLEFEKARSGGFNAFTFIMPTYKSSESFTGEYVATGDGSTTAFDLPCKGGSSIVIYDDGSPRSVAVDATSAGDCYITENGGEDGGDRVTFFVAPSDGSRITIDFTGRLVVRCTFIQSIQYDREHISQGFNQAQVQLKGLLMDE